MSQTRWACPNGCPSVLGPTRPNRDHTCRICLNCTREGATHVVHRIPATLEKRREAKAEAKRERARKEAELKAESKRRYLQRVAPDYHIVIPSASRPSQSFSELKGKLGALHTYRELLKCYPDATLVRVRLGRSSKAIFHGRKLISWEFEDGTTQPAN